MPEFQINYLAVGVAALATVFIGALVMAFVLAVLVSWTGVSTVPQGAFLGLLL